MPKYQIVGTFFAPIIILFSSICSLLISSTLNAINANLNVVLCHNGSSKRHIGENRKERCDKILSEKCELCDYKPTKTTNMKLHYLNKHASFEERQIGFNFYCYKCDFGCFVEILYIRHLETKKHINN